MKIRKLGNSGLEVSNLCFGGNIFGWTLDEANSFKVLDAYYEAGGNFIDTADVYSRWKPGNQGGESETIIGKWMKDRKNREKVIITTKVGLMSRPIVTAPIASATSVDQLNDLIAATDLKLSSEAIQILDTASDPIRPIS